MTAMGGEGNQMVVDPEEAEVDDADLASLPYLTQANVLEKLRIRYSEQGHVYSFASGKILVAVNPWRETDLCGEDAAATYTACEGEGRASGAQPHVFAVSMEAYRCVAMEGRAQSVLVSGESGSGKTETCKYVIQHLAALSKLHAPPTSPLPGVAGGADDASLMGRRVLQSNPVLESFGNAKTLRNDNSSRFGKFIALHFSPAGMQQPRALPRITGGAVQTYLLEKSRVTTVSRGERNYHIFYQLCAACQSSASDSAKAPLVGVPEGVGLEQGASAFGLTAMGGCVSVDGVEDALEFSKTMRAMEAMGVTCEESKGLLRSVAALMHFGRVRFVSGEAPKGRQGLPPSVPKGEDGEAARVDVGLAGLSLGLACRLLGCPEAKVSAALCVRVVKTRGEEYSVQNTVAQAEEARNALSRGIYIRIFRWLVAKINASLGGSSYAAGGTESVSLPGSPATGHEVNILDIFGFEFFERNGFEQLCINFANEKLQCQFNDFMVRLEQEEYHQEGVEWVDVEISDNTDCVRLLEARPGGLLDLIDEEGRLPRGSDEGFVEKLRSVDSPYLALPPVRNGTFSVVHYAASVTYSVQGFTERNKDTLPADFVPACQASSSMFVASLFSHERQTSAPKRGESRRGRSPGVGVSVGAEFRRELCDLMSFLGNTSPHYIRCINPNSEKKPGGWDAAKVQEQLHCSGLLGAMQLMRSCYQVRYKYSEFASRYSLVLDAWRRKESVPVGDWDAKRDCSCIEESGAKCLGGGDGQVEEKDSKIRHGAEEQCLLVCGLGLDETMFALGKTKVFLRESAASALQSSASEIKIRAAKQLCRHVSRLLGVRVAQGALVRKKEGAVKLQRLARSMIWRKRMVCARILAAHAEAFACRAQWFRLNGAVAALKVSVKRRIARERFEQLREAATALEVSTGNSIALSDQDGAEKLESSNFKIDSGADSWGHKRPEVEDGDSSVEGGDEAHMSVAPATPSGLAIPNRQINGVKSFLLRTPSGYLRSGHDASGSPIVSPAFTQSLRNSPGKPHKSPTNPREFGFSAVMTPKQPVRTLDGFLLSPRDHLDVERRKKIQDAEMARLQKEQEDRENRLLEEIDAVRQMGDKAIREIQDQFEIERKGWEGEKARLQAACRFAEESERERRQELEELQEVCAEVGKELVAARGQAQKERQDLEEIAGIAREEVQELRSQQLLQQRDSHSRVKMAEHEAESLRKQLEDAKGGWEREKRTRREEERVLEERLSEAESRIDERKQTEEALRSKVEDLETRCVNVEQEYRSLSVARDEVQQQLSMAVTSIAALETESKGLHRDAESLKAEKVSLEAAKTCLEREKVELLQHLEQLQQTYSEANDRLLQAQAELQSREQENEELKKQAHAESAERDGQGNSEQQALERLKEAVSMANELVNQRDAYRADLSRVTENLSKVERERDSLQQDLISAQQKNEEAEADRDQGRQNILRIEKDRSEIQEHVSHLQQKLEVAVGERDSSALDLMKIQGEAHQIERERDDFREDALRKARESDVSRERLSAVEMENKILKLKVEELEGMHKPKDEMLLGRRGDLHVICREATAAMSELSDMRQQFTTWGDVLPDGEEKKHFAAVVKLKGDPSAKEGIEERVKHTLDRMRQAAEKDVNSCRLLSDIAERTNQSVRKGREEARQSIARCHHFLSNSGQTSTVKSPSAQGESTRTGKENNKEWSVSSVRDTNIAPATGIAPIRSTLFQAEHLVRPSVRASPSSDNISDAAASRPNLVIGQVSDVETEEPRIPKLRLTAGALQTLSGGSSVRSRSSDRSSQEGSRRSSQKERGEGFTARTTRKGLQKLQKQSDLNVFLSSAMPSLTPDSGGARTRESQSMWSMIPGMHLDRDVDVIVWKTEHPTTVKQWIGGDEQEAVAGDSGREGGAAVKPVW